MIAERISQFDNYQKVRSLLGPRELLRDKVKKALEASSNGGFRIGTPGFIRYITGPQNLSIDELAICREILTKEINEIKKEEKVKKAEADKRNNDFIGAPTLTDFSDYSKDAAQRTEEEARRISGLGKEFKVDDDPTLDDIGY